MFHAGGGFLFCWIFFFFSSIPNLSVLNDSGGSGGVHDITAAATVVVAATVVTLQKQNNYLRIENNDIINSSKQARRRTRTKLFHFTNSDSQNNNNNNDNNNTTVSTSTTTITTGTTSTNYQKTMRAIVYDRGGGTRHRAAAAAATAAVAVQEATVGLKQIQLPQTPTGNRRGRILVQTHAVGLNPVDAKDVVGDKLPHHWTWMKSKITRSLLHRTIVGFDFSGTVLEDHEGFQRGEKVFGTMPPLQGTLTEQLSVPVDQICHMPMNTNFVQAAALPLVGLTALQSLSPYLTTRTSNEDEDEDEDDENSGNTTTTNNNNPRTSPNRSVLIVGASGGVGHVAVQVARNLGAIHVTAICSNRNKTFVESCGATHVVDYTQNEGRLETLYDNLLQAPGHPFGLILDCVTSADPRDRILDYPSFIRRGGRSSTTTSSSSSSSGASNSNEALQQQQQRSLVTNNHKYLRLGGPSPDWLRAGMERFGCSSSLVWWPDRHEKLFWIRFPHSSHELWQLQQWVQEGKLIVQVSHTVPFTADGVQSAFDEILQRRVQGKIVVEVIPSSSSHQNDEKNNK